MAIRTSQQIGCIVWVRGTYTASRSLQEALLATLANWTFERNQKIVFFYFRNKYARHVRQNSFGIVQGCSDLKQVTHYLMTMSWIYFWLLISFTSPESKYWLKALLYGTRAKAYAKWTPMPGITNAIGCYSLRIPTTIERAIAWRRILVILFDLHWIVSTRASRHEMVLFQPLRARIPKYHWTTQCDRAENLVNT